jgi:hypothetical protein
MVNARGQTRWSQGCPPEGNDAAWTPWNTFRTLILARREASFLR